jgi:hypothetical protein
MRKSPMPVVLAVFGIGLGVLLLADRSRGRAPLSLTASAASTLRDLTVEAQRISARASQLARELAATWSETQRT